MKAGHSNSIYFLTDALGSVRSIVNASGAVVQSYEFDEWGNHLSGSGSGSVTSQKTFHGGLSVNDETADTGLYLMGHRFFASDLGRFINRDPIGFAGGLNLYAGMANNPVNFTDAAGLSPITEIGGGLVEISIGVVISPEPSPTGELLVTDGARRVRRGMMGLGVSAILGSLAAPGASGSQDPAGQDFRDDLSYGVNAYREQLRKEQQESQRCNEPHPGVHRAVGPNERNSIQQLGKFSPNPSGISGKYFYPTRDQAVTFAHSRTNRRKPQMWRATGNIPPGLPHEHFTPGTEGPAIFIENPHLGSIRQATVVEQIK